jgi:diguanylate cyclase (GGDEF)-like protein/PAS domain S-box-containing protein
VAAGDYRVRLDETGPAEIVDLARAFNRMGASLDKAVNDLRASQEQLAVTLHSIGDALIATDLAGQVVLMNPVAERLTGWPLAEARGKAVREVFRIENAKTGHAAEIPVERVLHEGLVVGLANHTVLFARDGGRVHIADSAAPIRDGQGNLIGVVMVFRDVSGEYRLREALRDSELHFRALANSGQALVWTSGTDMGCDYFNDIWLRFTGRSLERELGNGWTEGVHPDDLAACMETYVAAFDRREPFSMTYRLRRYDGAYRWIVDEGSPRHDGDGRFLGYVGHCLDITDRIEAEAEADRRRRELEAVFQALPDLFFRMTADGTILDFKAQRHADLYLTPEHFLGKRLRDVMPPEIAERFDQGVAEMRATGLPATYQYSLRMPDGERWFESRVNGLAGSDEIIALVREISDRKQAEREIHRLAYYDALTDLPNRRLFMDHLGLALAAARRSQQFGALLFVDLDQFKRVNDARGHGIGDAVLTQVGGRLHRFLRDDDTVARLGGDEFVVLLASLAGNVDTAARLAMAVAEKVRAVLATPFRVDDVDYHIGASIGITVFPKAGENAEDLLREADTAMYRAKEAGRNAIRYFEPAMQQAVQTRLALEQDLHDAIAGDELRLYLQPQLDRDGELVGAEALLRWQHPVRGLVAPTTFIPVAEESGMILALGDWVLREAARLSREFDDSGRPLRLAVNVSPRQFRQAGFVADVRETLRQAGADPTHLVLEVTESLVIEDIHDTIAKMEELSKLGIHFSIDDFGTGYSSLAYLKRLPLNELKIDRTFVQDAPTDPNDAALVETILSVASHLNLSVVAEGVETQAQLDFLKARGCRLFQGYLFDRPLPPERFRENWR